MDIFARWKVLRCSQTCADKKNLRVAAYGSFIFHLGITDHDAFAMSLRREELFFRDLVLRSQDDAFLGKRGKTKTGELRIKRSGLAAGGEDTAGKHTKKFGQNADGKQQRVEREILCLLQQTPLFFIICWGERDTKRRRNQIVSDQSTLCRDIGPI